MASSFFQLPSPAYLSFSEASPTLPSPPSLDYSEASSECDETSTPDIMAIASESHVSDVMAEALSHLNRVVEHLRGEDENEAANGIARNVHAMLDTFNQTTAPWPIDKFHMKALPPPKHPSIPQNGNGCRPIPRPNASSWAAVAATEISRNNRLVKFRPSDGLKRLITDEEVDKPHSQDEDLRCIWIYGWTRGKPLNVVTDRISTGAIFSMAYVEDYEAVCVIFQYASAAMHFMEQETDSIREFDVGLFGKGHEVKYGEAYPENKDLARMQPPINERRRLTFARQQLFTNGLTEEKFRRDLTDMVGTHNLELVWLFNTGNATAVFSSTVVARIVREEFMRRSRRSGPYQEVQVGFSHDPCERPMNLITQIPYPGAAPRDRADSYKSGSSGRSHVNGAKLATAGSARGKKTADTDGWQTVSRKK